MRPNPAGGSGLTDGRDSWCTPLWLAKLIGRVKLDPCSNARSHVKADIALTLEAGDNGLCGCPSVRSVVNYASVGAFFRKATTQQRATKEWTTFINPPYAKGDVEKWVRHYRHTRYVFLLRLDPSTRWFSLLMETCTNILLLDKRINFEPPPGVKASSNPFPHALYLRDPPIPLLARLAACGYALSPEAT